MAFVEHKVEYKVEQRVQILPSDRAARNGAIVDRRQPIVEQAATRRLVLALSD
jgi:hypothetical protein